MRRAPVYNSSTKKWERFNPKMNQWEQFTPPPEEPVDNSTVAGVTMEAVISIIQRTSEIKRQSNWLK